MIWFLQHFYRGLTVELLQQELNTTFNQWTRNFEAVHPISNLQLTKSYLDAKSEEEKVAIINQIVDPIKKPVRSLYEELFQIRRRRWADVLMLSYDDWIKYENTYTTRLYDSSNFIRETNDDFLEVFYQDIEKLGETSDPVVMDNSAVRK
jgi:hypothetical protein